MNRIVMLGLFVFSLLSIHQAQAKTYEIKMLNTGKDGAMVFEPPFLKVAKGDTVKFTPVDQGHDVASFFVPKGGKPWAAEVGKGVSTKMEADGVYIYECKSHVALAMVGVIEVGNASNLADAQAAAKGLSSQIMMNKDRLDKYLAQAK